MGKIVLITGASSGIGRSTALMLLDKGYTVYGAARRVERMADIENDNFHALQMDVTDKATMISGVKRIIDEQGRIDVLVNNAGYGSYGAIEDVELSEAKYQFDVNVFGLARMTQLVIPHMRAQKSGRIINITSMGGIIYAPLGGWYHATKFALEGFSDCLRFETKQFGIDVVIVEPGAIKTEWDEIAIENMLKTSGESAYAELTQKTAEMMRKTYQNKHVSHPDVIAKTILKAINARKPKTRYAAGHRAKLFIFLRRLFSDRIYDFILRKNLK